MKPYWVETGNHLRLAIVPRSRGGDWLGDELDQMKRAGIDVLVSMLQGNEAAELGLSSEAELCEARGIVFRSFPIPDRETPPATTSFSRFIEDLRADAHAGRSVAVHCRASTGRSSLLLAALLTAEGFAPDDAFRRLTVARGLQVPDTADQVRWVERFAATRQVPWKSGSVTSPAGTVNHRQFTENPVSRAQG
jgi:protein-tyrosine phosphatase